MTTHERHACVRLNRLMRLLWRLGRQRGVQGVAELLLGRVDADVRDRTVGEADKHGVLLPCEGDALRRVRKSDRLRLMTRHAVPHAAGAVQAAGHNAWRACVGADGEASQGQRMNCPASTAIIRISSGQHRQQGVTGYWTETKEMLVVSLVQLDAEGVGQNGSCRAACVAWPGRLRWSDSTILQLPVTMPDGICAM